MDWPNELYVKLYRRVTADDLALSWEARALWHEMLKRFDRSGIITSKRGPIGLANLVLIPVETVERAIAELIADGRVQAVEGGYLAPNFLTAQESRKSDQQRQRESRERRRSITLSGSAVTKRDGPSQIVTNGHDQSHDVTSGHIESHDVTSCHSEIRREEKRRDEKSARAREGCHEESHGVTKRDITDRNDRSLSRFTSALYHGIFDVKDTKTGELLGYVERLPTGEYREVTPDGDA